MLTVNHDVAAVESSLVDGLLVCLHCQGVLAPWGSARPRSIRHGVGGKQRVLWHHPRRARCTACRATHVLLPVVLAARRADSADVIAQAVGDKAALGVGHRTIAACLGRPVSTVRGWLRSFAASAGQITERFTLLAARHAVDAAAIWPAAVRGPTATALSALMAYAHVAGVRHDVVGTVTWFTAGLLDCQIMIESARLPTMTSIPQSPGSGRMSVAVLYSIAMSAESIRWNSTRPPSSLPAAIPCMRKSIIEGSVIGFSLRQ